MSRLRAALLAAAVAVTGLTVLATGGSPAGADVASGVRAAASYAARHRMRVGVAVLDTTTGALYTAGDATTRYSTASVAKTLIATRLLLEHRMRGHDAALATIMIEGSDNDAAYALYPAVGGDGLLPWLARHYRISGFGARPTQPGRWGSTQVTAVGLARFYAAVRRDPVVWPWLSRAMHAHRRFSTAGQPNDFGIAAAAPASAVKNGWAQGRDVHAPGNAIINTTGFVDRDRYAVVVLGEGPGSLYFTAGERIISATARLIMPGGHITPTPPPAVTGLSVPSGPTSGAGRVTVAGRGLTRVRAVLFGTVPAHLVAVGTRAVTVVAPAHAPGGVAVRIVGYYGTSAAVSAATYRYGVPPTLTTVTASSGSSAGGTVVTVRGAHLTGTTAVLVGGVRASAVHVSGDALLTATTPAHAAGPARVVVVTAYGTSPGGPTFTFVAPDPSTPPPTTAPPSSDAPSSDAPSSDAPSSDAPSSDAPSTP